MDKNFPRLLQTLKLIPRYPKMTSTEDIRRQLQALGYIASRRTVERDLQALSATYGVECDDRSRPYGWRWSAESRPPVWPVLDLSQALGLSLMEQELGAALPQVVRQAMEPWFEESRRRLAAEHGKAKAARWPKKLVFQSIETPLLPAKVQPDVADAVNEALFSECPLTVEYRAAYAEDFRVVRLHPLGLVHTERVTYLVACFDGYEDPRQLPLHRMRRAKVDAGATLKPPAEFNMQDYLKSDPFGYGSNEPIRLRLRMHEDTARHLLETPLSRDQEVKPDDREEGYVIVEATVKKSKRIQWWINGFGDLVQRLPDGEILKNS